MDIVSYNRTAWANEVAQENMWTIPVSTDTIDRARAGDYSLLLTPTVPVPKDWVGDVRGKRVLCLASGGGQQGPVFAALGAKVTVFDNCPQQLAKDQMVAQRDGLIIQTVQGDMRDLSCFGDETFDLIFHPVSNCFVEAVRPVWKEAYRILSRGGTMVSGFANPITYLFDFDEMDQGEPFRVRYKIPYADTLQLPPEKLAERIKNKEPMEFGHTLEDQIGGQLDAGFLLSGFYEDTSPHDPLSRHINIFIATRTVKI